MINILEFIEANQNLINRFVDLSMCRDKIQDTRRTWFYSLIPYETLLSIQHLISEDDLRQDITLRIVELANDAVDSKALKQYLHKDIGWFLRDKLDGLVRPTVASPPEEYDYVDESKLDVLDLRNIINETGNPYGKYLLYLFAKKSYTINQISELLYQDRSTIRKRIKKEIDTCQSKQ